MTPLYFKLNHGAKLPDYLVQATQHYDNQFEMPVLYLYRRFIPKLHLYRLSLAAYTTTLQQDSEDL